MAVARVGDGGEDERVIATTESVQANVPGVISRASNVKSGVGGEGSILVVVAEDRGALILANEKIAVSSRNGSRGNVDTNRVGSRATESVVVPGEGLNVSVVGASKGQRSSLRFAVSSSVTRLARADGSTAESTHRAAVRAAIGDRGGDGETATVGITASVAPDSNVPVAGSSINERDGGSVVHRTIGVVELELSGDGSTADVDVQIGGGSVVGLSESESQGRVGVREVNTEISPRTLLDSARVRSVHGESGHAGRAIGASVVSSALALSHRVAKTVVVAVVGAGSSTEGGTEAVVALTEGKDTNVVASRGSSGDVVGDVTTKRDVTPVVVSVRRDSVVLDEEVAIGLGNIVSLVHLEKERVGVARRNVDVKVVPVPHRNVSSEGRVEGKLANGCEWLQRKSQKRGRRSKQENVNFWSLRSWKRARNEIKLHTT